MCINLTPDVTSLSNDPTDPAIALTEDNNTIYRLICLILIQYIARYVVVTFLHKET